MTAYFGECEVTLLNLNLIRISMAVVVLSIAVVVLPMAVVSLYMAVVVLSMSVIVLSMAVVVLSMAVIVQSMAGVLCPKCKTVKSKLTVLYWNSIPDTLNNLTEIVLCWAGNTMVTKL